MVQGQQAQCLSRKCRFFAAFLPGNSSHDLLVEKALVLIVARALPGHKFADG
jgi:hypothetical protein